MNKGAVSTRAQGKSAGMTASMALVALARQDIDAIAKVSALIRALECPAGMTASVALVVHARRV